MSPWAVSQSPGQGFTSQTCCGLLWVGSPLFRQGSWPYIVTNQAWLLGWSLCLLAKRSCPSHCPHRGGPGLWCTHVLCFNPVSISAPHSCWVTPSQWDGDSIIRVKVRKCRAWDKDSLVGKAKPKQNKTFFHYFPWAGSCSGISRTAGLHHVEWWLGKTKTITLNIPSFLILPPALCAEQDAIWYGILLWSVWLSCPSCVPSQFVHSQLPHWWGGVRGRKGLGSVLRTAQQQLKHPSFINTIFSTNPKHSPTPPTLKKINYSSPGKTSTLS